MHDINPSLYFIKRNAYPGHREAEKETAFWPLHIFAAEEQKHHVEQNASRNLRTTTKKQKLPIKRVVNNENTKFHAIVLNYL